MKQFITKYEKQINKKWIEEIKTEKGKEILFHIYSGISDKILLKSIMQTLLNEFPESNIVGTESGGEILNGILSEPAIIISCLVFTCSEIKIQVIENIAGNERNIGKELRRTFNRTLAEDLKACELLLPGATLNTMEMFDELRLCDPDIAIFGGYAGNHNVDLKNTFVMHNAEFYKDTVIAIMYCGKDFHINIAKSAGWQQLGLPFKITKANGHILNEINDLPATDIYKRYLNIDVDENFVDNTSEFPLAAYVGGEELLRHTNSVLDDGSLSLAGYVLKDWDVYLTFGNPSGILDDVNKRLKEVYLFAPQAILLYTCYVRKLFWEKFVNVEIQPFQELAPTSGFYTFGEILRNMDTGEILEYNITLLSIIMREGPSKKIKQEIPKASDTILTGQSSLVKRLAELVSSSTTEIQKAYNNLEKINQQLRFTSEHDALTGLYNRGRTEALISNFLSVTRNSGMKSSLVMFDIDYFKKINDQYGHKTGDTVLKELSEIVLSLLNEENNEIAGRWGGEEFFVLLPGYDENKGFQFAEMLRKKVENHLFANKVKTTVSLGVMTVNGFEDPNEVYIHIDNALYKAKDRGRNATMKV